MKLHADQPNALNTVTAYGQDYIEVNRVKFIGSTIIMPQGDVLAWGVEAFDDLTTHHFETLSEKNPELVILGTGSKQRFPHPKLTSSLINRHIGVEAMDTQAACRTYNILMAEGRQVLLALLPLGHE